MLKPDGNCGLERSQNWGRKHNLRMKLSHRSSVMTKKGQYLSPMRFIGCLVCRSAYIQKVTQVRLIIRITLQGDFSSTMWTKTTIHRIAENMFSNDKHLTMLGVPGYKHFPFVRTSYVIASNLQHTLLRCPMRKS